MKITSVEYHGSQVFTVTQVPSHPACVSKFSVDLRAANWNGSCTCQTFTEVCSYLLRVNPTKRQRCDHIIAARQWFMENEVPKLLTDENFVLLPDCSVA